MQPVIPAKAGIHSRASDCHSQADQLVKGLRYERIDDWYETTQFDDEIEAWEQYLVPAKRSLYDYVPYDSEVEQKFVEGLERRPDVRLFAKLPNWFTVPTPVGDYNPDWAIVMDEYGEVIVYLVRETKDTLDPGKLRPEEQRKIECGQKHFDELQVSYEVITNAGQLPFLNTTQSRE